MYNCTRCCLWTSELLHSSWRWMHIPLSIQGYYILQLYFYWCIQALVCNRLNVLILFTFFYTSDFKLLTELILHHGEFAFLIVFMMSQKFLVYHLLLSPNLGWEMTVVTFFGKTTNQVGLISPLLMMTLVNLSIWTIEYIEKSGRSCFNLGWNMMQAKR